MQFETLPALPDHVPSADRVFGPARSQLGSKSSDLNFRIAKKCFDNFAGFDRLFLAQVNVGVASDRNRRSPTDGGDAPAPGPGMSKANFGVN